MTRLDGLTSPGFARAAAGRLVALLPVGSVEPHGPHLPLGTDNLISEAAAARAVTALETAGWTVVIAPTIPYGVTDCAAGFPGAVSVSADALTAYVGAVVDGLHAAGAGVVCIINNHLEPAHDAALTAVARADRPWLAIACPLRRTWARTLTDEFKSGACHAGRYETSIVLAHAPTLVDDTARADLPEVPISLSTGLRAGLTTFAAMGLSEAYAGAPAAATAAEGTATLDLLAAMIIGEVEAAAARLPA